MAGPAICVLIATSGRARLLPRTLAAVREQAAAAGGEVRLVVNDSEDAFSPEQREAWRAAADALEFEPAAGKSRALNRGIRSTAAPVVAFTDDDALPDPGWLAALTAPLLRPGSPWAGTGGRVLPVLPEETPAWYRRLLVGQRAFPLGPLHDRGDAEEEYSAADPARSEPPPGVNCAYRRELLLEPGYRPELGPNRETGMRGGEDSELALRLMRAGHRLLYEPRAIVRHPVESDRLTRDFAEERFRLLGQEWIRILRLLGDPAPPAAQLQSKARKHRRRWVQACLVAHPRRYRHRLREIYYRGALAELAGG